MVNAVNSLLNNAADLYVLAVNYRRIPTSQISTRLVPESGDVRQMSRDSGSTGQIPANLARNWPERPDVRLSSRDTSRILPGSGQNGWISGHLVGILAIPAGSAHFVSDSGKDCRNLYVSNIKKIFLYYFILTFFF
jgi:hypothetical protein